MFVDPDNGDYHLQGGSPCIDAGTPVGAPADDIEGNPRDDGYPDMGAYEGEAVACYSCIGFDPPMDKGAVKVKKNRVLPLKAQLLDDNGNLLTDLDIAAPPVIQVMYQSQPGEDPEDVTDQALSAGMGTEGNKFEFDGEKWHFNLKTKNYTASGTYTISMVSGDESEYVIDPTCTAVFVVQ
jgi:hypothetical protein